jgi:hypothetical protein
LITDNTFVEVAAAALVLVDVADAVEVVDTVEVVGSSTVVVSSPEFW